MALALFLCSLGGYAFAKFKHAPGRNLLFAFALGTMMIPAAVTMLPVFIVLARLNLVNTWWAMIIPGAANAFGIFWMRQYIAANIHDDLLAAARIDGCSEFGIYAKVYLPLSLPAMAAVGTLEFTWIFNDYLWALVLLKDNNLKPVTTGLSTLQGQYISSWNVLVAGSLLATIPTVVVFIFLQRYFIEGLTMGSGK